MNKNFENKHLEPIFNIVLPAIEKAGINYWVYGGVAIAGIKGSYYRLNQDVDIFVMDKDYEKTAEIIKNLSYKNSWILESTKKIIGGIRPKYELFKNANEKECLSLIPVYENDNEVQFVFEPGSLKVSMELLKPIIRNIGILHFITPSEAFIKELLRYYLKFFIKSKKRENKKLLEKRKKDTRELLGYEEAKKFFP